MVLFLLRHLGELGMKNKSLLLALGASLSLGLGAAAQAESSSNIKGDQLKSGYAQSDGTMKLAEGKCGEGKCGEGKCGEGTDSDKE